MSTPESDKQQSMDDFLNEMSALLDPDAAAIADLRKAEKNVVDSLEPVAKKYLDYLCLGYVKQYFDGTDVPSDDEKYIDKAANRVLVTLPIWRAVGNLKANQPVKKLLKIVSPGVIGLYAEETREHYQQEKKRFHARY